MLARRPVIRNLLDHLPEVRRRSRKLSVVLERISQVIARVSIAGLHLERMLKLFRSLLRFSVVINAAPSPFNAGACSGSIRNASRK